MKIKLNFKQITGLDAPNIYPKNHPNICFVDDTSAIIGFKSKQGIKTYLEKYFQLMKCYYNINMLKVNPDKSQLMVSAKPKYLNETKFLQFQADEYVIKNKPCMTILGSILSCDLSNEREITAPY